MSRVNFPLILAFGVLLSPSNALLAQQAPQPPSSPQARAPLDLTPLLSLGDMLGTDFQKLRESLAHLRSEDGSPAIVDAPGSAGGLQTLQISFPPGAVSHLALDISVKAMTFRSVSDTCLFAKVTLFTPNDRSDEVHELLKQTFATSLVGESWSMVKTIRETGEVCIEHNWRTPKMTVTMQRVLDSGKFIITNLSARANTTEAKAEILQDVQYKRTELDPMLNLAEFWTWTPEKLESQYAAKSADEQSKPGQFEWLTQSKERARFSRQLYTNIVNDLTLFSGELRVQEAVVEFVNGRAARVVISIYNRGDAGEIRPDAFERIFKQTGQKLGQTLQVTPRNQPFSGNAALKTVTWIWQTPHGVALLEHNEFKSGAAVSRPEFLRLKLASPTQMDWSMGKLSTGVQRMALVKNVVKQPSGDVYISGVPMVDQGNKGYCVAASCQRLFEYMQIPCDQHEIAQLLNVDAERGANPEVMQKSLTRIDAKFNVTFKPIINPELYYDSRRRRRVSLKEFVSAIKESTDKGMPLLWALMLGRFPETPGLPMGGQISGGHMRMIIGYNPNTNEVLFTDSWGAGHELKRMAAADAYEASLGLFSMTPRGM